MIMILILASLVTLDAHSSTDTSSARPPFPQDHIDEVRAVLRGLSPVWKEDSSGAVGHGPSPDTQEQARRRLLEIANESPQARAEVVRVLIEVLRDPSAKQEFTIADRWLTAVHILGELRAVEATDILIENLDETGQNGIIISIHFQPVKRALIQMGEPAVPKLIEALSHERPSIRNKAASTLARIGNAAFPKLVEALLNGKPSIKCGAALALAWIGSDEARIAIEGTIEIEMDEDVKRALEKALTEMRRFGGEEKRDARQQ